MQEQMSKVENDDEDGSRIPMLCALSGTKQMRPFGPRTPEEYLAPEEMEDEMSKVENDDEDGSKIPMLSA